LNLTPDHLDRHHTLQAYAAAKARIFENQTPQDAAILNADDAATTPYAPSKLQVFWFSRKQRVEQGAYLSGDEIMFPRGGREEAISSPKRYLPRGAHNLENVLAAVAATRLAGSTPAAIRSGIKSFAGVEHRSNWCPRLRVRYYNDSKATNVDATLKALDAFPGRILIILGGKDKGSDYTAAAEAVARKSGPRPAHCSAAPKIESQITGSVAIDRAETLERAVEIASHAARPGDVSC